MVKKQGVQNNCKRRRPYVSLCRCGPITKRNIVKKQVSVVIAVLLSVLVVPSAYSAEPKLKPAVAKSAELNSAASAYGKVGVRRCLKSIVQVTDFLTAGSKSGLFLFSPPDQPDNRMLSTSMEIASGNGISYASASFSPRDNDCGAVYEAVTYWQDSCDIVATRVYTTLRQSGVVQTHVRVLDGGPAMRVFLMPAGTGCIAIKKEVLY